MKNCIVCGAETIKDNEFCDTCLEFFTWKYKTGLKNELDRFRKTKEYLEWWREQSTEKEVKE
ncbi:MAG: hypothetical protein ACP5NS_01340 [Candidatus Pacearchaeota archaeon]